jgi:hypothetical protein
LHVIVAVFVTQSIHEVASAAHCAAAAFASP